MSITIDGQERRIGLALSGGGFRAAAFHLGVFRALHACGLLAKIDLLTCVSGGSIAGAFLASRWGQPDVLEQLEHYLLTRSIAVGAVLGGLLDPFESRIDKLAQAYDRDLFQGATMASLAGGPRIYLNATNLATGNMFFFVAGGGKATELGEWELGTSPADDFPLARAVAASSAFPPVFPPLRLSQAEFPTPLVDYVTLSDGGLYDNLGVNPIFRSRNELSYALVSDAGKPFEFDQTPTESGSKVLIAGLRILMEQVRGLQFKRIELSAPAGLGPKGLWCSIDSTEGEINPGDAAFCSVIGTNLKKLSAPELSVLTRHGGALMMARLKRYAPELLVP